MAEATSREVCIDRHRSYHIDVSTRLSTMQRRRLQSMCRDIREGEKVLDVGCNTGYIVDFLPRGCKAYGVDVAEVFVEEAAKRLLEAEVAPAEELPYPDKSMDVVILGELLEHVYEPIEVVREACRVARRLVVGSTPHEAGKWGPNGPRPPATHKFHVRCFSEEELRAALEDGGLVNVRFSVVERDGPQIRVFIGEVGEPTGTQSTGLELYKPPDEGEE